MREVRPFCCDAAQKKTPRLNRKFRSQYFNRLLFTAEKSENQSWNILMAVGIFVQRASNSAQPYRSDLMTERSLTMKWFAVAALAATIFAPSAASAQRFVELAIGRIPPIEDKSPNLWGMSGMEMVLIKEGIGTLTPGMRTEMYDARTVEILSRTIAPPLRSSDVKVVARNGKQYIVVRRFLLMEVTPQDAKADSTTIPELAKRWRQKISTVLPQVAPTPSRFGI
jgi:hypothetical protein